MTAHRYAGRLSALVAVLFLLASQGLLLPPPAASQGGAVSGPEDISEGEAPSDSPDVPIARLDNRLKTRAVALYTFLEGKRVNLYSLYQNETFRDFFTTEQALQNYIAFLSTRLAHSRFRKFRIERTEIMGFLPGGAGQVKVEVKLIGRHHQPFLFWDKTEIVRNTWRKEDGEWFVYPPPY
ncbi:MAG: hypothetical protein ACE5FC_04525 [Myxococcota bacterium]